MLIRDQKAASAEVFITSPADVFMSQPRPQNLGTPQAPGRQKMTTIIKQQERRCCLGWHHWIGAKERQWAQAEVNPHQAQQERCDPEFRETESSGAGRTRHHAPASGFWEQKCLCQLLDYCPEQPCQTQGKTAASSLPSIPGEQCVGQCVPLCSALLHGVCVCAYVCAHVCRPFCRCFCSMKNAVDLLIELVINIGNVVILAMLITLSRDRGRPSIFGACYSLINDSTLFILMQLFNVILKSSRCRPWEVLLLLRYFWDFFSVFKIL